MIKLRSDGRYAGADWLCDYISVQRVERDDAGSVVNEGTVVTFQFPCGEWIEDTNIHQYHATAGYDYDLPEHQVNWIQYYGAKHYILPDSETSLTISTVLDIDVIESSVKVFKISTGAEISVEADAIAATFSNQIESSLNKQVDNKLHNSTTIASVVTIGKKAQARTLQEVWSECDYSFTAKLGTENEYTFRLPQNRVFSGFKEVPSMWPETYSPM